VNKIPISEIFFSFSGEGKSTGIMAVFVRVSGCNFFPKSPCRYCDTGYALNDKNGKDMTVTEIMTEVIKYPTNYVILTGGEPCMYPEMYTLSERLLSENYEVETLTNGSIPLYKDPWSLYNGIFSMDIKTPSSGNKDKNDYCNLDELVRKDMVKFVIGDKKDWDFTLTILKEYPTEATILVQPSYDKIDVKKLVEWIKKDLPKARLSQQTQKFVYGNMKRGV
jgi:7-carboxy-7-deazaguanine synthase